MPMQVRTPITRLRAPTTPDGYGNLTRDWASATSTAMYVHWSAKAVSEVVGDEPQTVTRVKVFAWPPFDLEATDRVVGPDGETYEVDGDIMRSYHPRSGTMHHLRAFLRRVAITGAP